MSTKGARSRGDLAKTGLCLDCHRAIRLQHASEGEESRKKEEAAAERKRKVDEKEEWERNRDDRVNSMSLFVCIEIVLIQCFY